MNFISTPLTIRQQPQGGWNVVRDIDNPVAMLDNLVELIVFTPRGSFDADPDFGFEYWNHEYANVPHRDFNNDQISYITAQVDNKGYARHQFQHFVTKKECQESVRQSLAIYAPQLTEVSVDIELDDAGIEGISKRKVHSRSMIKIIVNGKLDDGLETKRYYHKEVKFLIEPIYKKVRF